MKGLWNSTSIIPKITLSFIFLFICYFEDVLAAPPTTRQHILCRPEQRDALLAFKNEFHIGKFHPNNRYCNGVGHRKTESWGNNSDCCSWKGITCDAKSGDVIKLDLHYSGLHGRFHSNSSLQNLPFLTTLDLSCNQFSGQILTSIGNLSNLINLTLSYNDFSGQIPSSIGNLFHLTSLQLWHNHFSGQIPSSIGNLSNLSNLSLSFNNFSGRIPTSIGNLFHLTILDLWDNHFSGQIPSWIGNLTQLTDLCFSLNQFSGEIPCSIGKLSQLTFLLLWGNKLVGKIPYSFGNLNNLAYLDVHSNMLSGNFPNVLLNLTGLIDLYIFNNQFSGVFPPNTTSLSNLGTFYASHNAFTGTIPSSLFTIPSLVVFDLSDNKLYDTLEFGNISSPSNLLELNIGNNNFKGPIPRSISKFVNLSSLYLSHFDTQGRPVNFSIFSHLKSLEILDISYMNTTTTIDLNDILSYFKGLSELHLSGNHVSTTNKSSVSNPTSQEIDSLFLSSCGIIEFPQLLRTLHGIEYLDISNNKIQGQVPGWLWTLPKLEYVNLTNNTFISFQTSKKKQGLSSVRKPLLRYLLGSNNNFSGKIPSFICELRSLNILDLSDNNFNGSIPPCLGNLNNTLSDLNLRHNNLSGGLPEDIIFESLRSLDVGHNQLVGKLPRSLNHLSTLEVLNVESNRINDTFPFWLGSLQKLRVLVLRSNAFHGQIHQASFPQLRIIDISHNHFYGTLPSEYFSKWTAMPSVGTDEDRSSEMYMGDKFGYYQDSMVLMNKGVELELVRILKIYTAIDFSGNKFEGEIPKSIGLLKELHVLNLSNNAFTGHIPSSMGNLKALESLDVSQNKLSGEIPQELGELSFLSYMNFSHNQLSGVVPGDNQFQTQPCSSFGDNLGLVGSSLDKVCGDIHTPPASHQQYETSESEEEDEEEVISWIAAAIGFVPGIVSGLTFGYILVSHKPEWFMNPFGRNNRRRRSTTTH